MENNVELIKSLFVDIDPNIINNDKLEIKDLPKEIIPYLKNLLKYTSGINAFKTYHNIEKIYNERKQNNELLHTEFVVAVFFTYIMNSNIITEEEKKILIGDIISFYNMRLSNKEVLSLKEKETMTMYSYTDISSTHIYNTINKIKALNKNNYNSNNLMDVLDKQIAIIMKTFLRLFKEEILLLNKQSRKRLIK